MQDDPKTGLRVTPGEEMTCNCWYVFTELRGRKEGNQDCDLGCEFSA